MIVKTVFADNEGNELECYLNGEVIEQHIQGAFE